MQGIGAGRRYAEAAFQLAVSGRAVDAWQRDLALAAGLARDERIARAVDSPAVPFGERRKIVEQMLGTKVSPQMRNLALILAKRGRFADLPDVSTEFDSLVRESRGIVAADVTTPSPLSEADLAKVRASVEHLAGGKVELTTSTDPRLVGGLTIKIGDKLIDASVQGRLERLRGRLVQGAS
jgi:F-type H+-transporting ATPase subunit delta